MAKSNAVAAERKGGSSFLLVALAGLAVFFLLPTMMMGQEVPAIPAVPAPAAPVELEQDGVDMMHTDPQHNPRIGAQRPERSSKR